MLAKTVDFLEELFKEFSSPSSGDKLLAGLVCETFVNVKKEFSSPSSGDKLLAQEMR